MCNGEWVLVFDQFDDNKHHKLTLAYHALSYSGLVLSYASSKIVYIPYYLQVNKLQLNWDVGDLVGWLHYYL